MKQYRLLLSIIAIGTLLASCGKLNSSLQDIRISEDNAYLASISDDVKAITDQAIETNKIGDLKRADIGSVYGKNAKITRDSSALPNVTITVDFGAGDTSNRGRVYMGKVIIKTNGKNYKDIGYTSEVTFSNFSVDGNTVENSSVINTSNVGPMNAQMTWEYNMNIIMVKKSNGLKVTAIGNGSKKQIEGIQTPEFGDDAYEATGEVNGTSEDAAYKFTITKPLLRRMNCAHICQGTVTYTKTETQGEKSMDFGDGTCDAKAVLTIEGVETTMSIK